MLKETKKRGLFIVFEGIDGAGKTTQINNLKDHLEAKGRKVHLTAEPTGSATGVLIRRALSGEIKKSECEMATLFALDRIIHNTDEECGIERMLSEGYDVLCDRYYYSSLAYQGSSTDFEWVKTMNLSCPEIRVPDACVFLDLTPQESLARITRDRDKIEIYETEEKLTAVRNKFYHVFKMLEGRERVFIVSSAGTIESVAKEIFDRIDTLL